MKTWTNKLVSSRLTTCLSCDICGWLLPGALSADAAGFIGTPTLGNVTDYVDNMKTGHPRLLTQDFSLYVQRADYEKYAKRAVDEMFNTATYPHWSQDAYLCTAENTVGVAFGYD